MDYILSILFFITIIEFSIGRLMENSCFGEPIGHMCNLNYKIVFVIQNSGLQLQCEDCCDKKNKNNGNKSISWSLTEINSKNELHDIAQDTLGISNHLEILNDSTLIINRVNVKDTKKIFTCNRSLININTNVSDTKIYNYLIEIIDPQKDMYVGDLNDWHCNFVKKLQSVQEKLNFNCRMKKNYGILDIYWSDWSICTCDNISLYSKRFKLAYPVVRIFSPNNNFSDLFFTRSKYLKLFYRGISCKVEDLQVFKLYELCMELCPGYVDVNYTAYKHQEVFEVTEGMDLSLVCPESSLLNSEIVWIKNRNIVIEKVQDPLSVETREHSFYIDMHNILHINNVSEFSRGYYSCFVNRFPMQIFKIIVIPVNSLTRGDLGELLNNLISLILILFLCLFIVGINLTKKVLDKQKTLKAKIINET